MLAIYGKPSRFCDGITRRNFLRIGALGLGGLTLPQILRAEAKSGIRNSHKAVIMIYLPGGPPHQDMFDLKIDAPLEIRGEFKPIKTNVPGIQICEHLPRLARIADRFSILRSVTHTNAGHGGGAHYMCTGKHPAAGFQESLTRPNNQHPFFGSVVARARGISREIPPYISVPML